MLDPACGSGNFLYLAYQELKRIEVMLLSKLDSLNSKQKKSTQIQMSLVTPNQFFGMDINPFGVELARVTLMIARKVAIDIHGLSEPALPLDTLDRNIICADALFTDWVKADAIIGNPPFLGGNRIRNELGDSYIEKLFTKFSDVVDQVDFCTYWFRLAHDNISDDGRAGLVGTNSISQGRSRIASLDYVVQNNGFIYEAIATQAWSGEAQVYVSLVNWSKQLAKICFLNETQVTQINSSLTACVSVTTAERLKANLNKCFEGVKPTGKGFMISEEQAKTWIQANSRNRVVLKPCIDADDLANSPKGSPRRWIIDFNNMLLEDASEYFLPFEHVKNTVKPERDKNRRDTRRINWWKFGEVAPNLRTAIDSLKLYFAVPAHAKWFIFLPTAITLLPNNSVKVIASDDFYRAHLISIHFQQV